MRSELDFEAFEKLIGPRTRLVAITHMSNVLGTVTPAKAIVAAARAKGVPVLLDGSQSAVHLPVDVQDLDCDFFVLTGHKVYRPTGIGVLYGKAKQLEACSRIYGWRRNDRAGHDRQGDLRAGTASLRSRHPPIVQAIGLGAPRSIS